MIRYIIMRSEPYEGLACVEAWGEDDDPLPTYASRDEAVAKAKAIDLISPGGRRNHAEILAVQCDVGVEVTEPMTEAAYEAFREHGAAFWTREGIRKALTAALGARRDG